MKNAQLLGMLILPVLAIITSSCGGNDGGGTPPSPPPQQPVAVSISPSSTTVEISKTAQFTATVSNTSNTSVTWSATCGSISTAGLYTAPEKSGSCTVKAASNADSSKSASAIVTVITPLPRTSAMKLDSFGTSADSCAAGFSWLNYYSPDKEGNSGHAVGKSIIITANGGIVAGIDSTPAGDAESYASLAFYNLDGTGIGILNDPLPSKITDMFLDSKTGNIFITGYFGAESEPDAHSAMILEVTPGARTIRRSGFQLSGRKTEGYAVAVHNSRIYLAVKSDHRQCELASGACSGDWVIVTDMQGQTLAQFPVGNTKNVLLSARTAVTDMMVLDDSIWITGDELNANSEITGSFLQQFSLEDGHSLLFYDRMSGRYGSRIIGESIEADGSLFIGSTAWNSQTDQSHLIVEKRDRRGSLLWPFEYSSVNGNNGSHISINQLKDLILNPEGGGITAVGALLKTTETGRSIADGGIVSWKKNGGLFWKKLFDSLPSGLSISTVNSVRYDTDGKVVFIGSGSDGRTCRPGSPCSFAVIGKSCYGAPAW